MGESPGVEGTRDWVMSSTFLWFMWALKVDTEVIESFGFFRRRRCITEGPRSRLLGMVVTGAAVA